MITIRAMTRTDIDDVYGIERASFRTPWSKASLIGELKNKVAHYLVLTVDDEIVGYCGLWVLFDEAHIANIAIRPDFRGRELGKILLYGTMKVSISHGAECMTLEVRESNSVAQNLYDSFDFVREGFRKRYYSDTGEGALLLWNHNIAKTVQRLTCIDDKFVLEYPSHN
ncbi:MAG TPA: ribosomal protein S18-alanine N-acetyltransferase [Eubacteriales bacterium]|nr:ribosomal protein S18-alanine N-acetyltransferase [Clostridia bacterium]HRV72358.1 ribosomal protein S18-alanine N-acetyltransferase [Eubacteriales bacterium]